jgi:hypothetical protein
MNPISKKLGLKPGMRVLVGGAPSGYLKSLAPLPEGVVISEALGGTREFVQFFVTKRAVIEKSAKKVLKSACPGGPVWITYLKKTSGAETDLSREVVWAAMQQWFNLSDPAVEEALYDSAALRQFVGIDLGCEPVPDETRCASSGTCWKSINWANRYWGR